MLYKLGNDFAGFDLSAMLDDVKMRMKHLSTWGRIVLVSDLKRSNPMQKSLVS